MVEGGRVSSFILWGPPGTGKTTIARWMARELGWPFHALNAVSSGVREVREVIAQGRENRRTGRSTLLFIDEIHRFNKAQQDALLSAVESGDLVLIGATTENPSFEVIPALRSRARVYVLNPLEEDALREILSRALREDPLLMRLEGRAVDEDALLHLSGGDARQMLSLLEEAAHWALQESGKGVDAALLARVAQRTVGYDKGGEEHYNVISAFIKSVRGSDPDGALYWLARMLAGGEDPIFIARRLVILAAEDVGNAAPNGLVSAQACLQAVHAIGMPEGRIILAQCATYLAGLPKSNAAYMGIERALERVRRDGGAPVPLHLRNAPTGLMKHLGYGSEYRYPHDEPGAFSRQCYLPAGLEGALFYQPTDRGTEKAIRERLARLWKGIKGYAAFPEEDQPQEQGAGHSSVEGQDHKDQGVPEHVGDQGEQYLTPAVAVETAPEQAAHQTGHQQQGVLGGQVNQGIGQGGSQPAPVGAPEPGHPLLDQPPPEQLLSPADGEGKQEEKNP